MDGPRRQRYVLCRPHGGLNDTLGVIGTCWRYAEATGRTLVVDADRSAFCSDFGEYFEPRDPAADVRFEATPELFAALNELSCHPAVVQGRLDTYAIAIQLHETLSHLEFRLPVEADTETPLYLDFDAVYGEAVVVHELYGGIPGAVDVLSRVRFTPWVQRVLRHRAVAVGGALERGVVEHHQLAVARQLQIELERIGTQRQRFEEGVERVLRRVRAVAAVADDRSGQRVEQDQDTLPGGDAARRSSRPNRRRMARASATARSSRRPPAAPRR